MPRAKILIVEDEGIEALDLQHRLISLGYSAQDIAATGEEALKMAEATSPDLVLMDIMLPGDVDGVTAAERIRARFDIPIIYITAYADEDTLQRAKITEPYGYIVKPFKERELHITIDMALYKHVMERKLRESEKWLATTLRSIGDAVIATDKNGRITFMNPVAERLTGWKQGEALNKKLTEVFNIINRDTRQPAENPVTRVILEGNIVALANHTRLIARDGREIPIDDSAAPIKDDKENLIGVVLVFRDITEREKAEQELRRAHDELELRVQERTAELKERVEQLARLSSQLTLAEQRERRRLAAIIHDHLQQLLVGVKIRLEVLGEQLGNDHQQSLEETYDLLIESLKTTRSLNMQMAPRILYESGLAPGLEWLAQTMQETYKIHIETDVEPGNLIEPEDLKVLLFESARELLFNVVKHAGSSSARLKMTQADAGDLRITVSDQGVGFDSDRLMKDLGRNDCFGLFSIRERLELIGGRMEIESSAGNGAVFNLIVPVDKKTAKEPLETREISSEETFKLF